MAARVRTCSVAKEGHTFLVVVIVMLTTEPKLEIDMKMKFCAHMR